MSSEAPTSGVSVRAIAWLLGTVACVLGVVEGATRLVALPSSRIERRVDQDLGAARRLRGPRTVLLVGNSLLLEGVRDSAVPTLVPSGWTIRRLGVEQTRFLDWQFALRELRRGGAEPSVVGVMLDARQLVSNLTRTDYSAYRLLGARDVVSMGRAAGLHPTETSRLVLSHYSAFYGLRAELRKILLARLVPGMDRLASAMIPPPGPAIDTLQIRSIATDRLRALSQEATEAGERFVFFVPPVEGDQAEVRAVARAARDAGVDIIMQDPKSPYVGSDFRDGYHLSETGAVRFEGEIRRALARALPGPR